MKRSNPTKQIAESFQPEPEKLFPVKVITPECARGDGLKPVELKVMGLNVPEQIRCQNIRTNIQRHLPQAQKFEPNKTELCLIGGGASLEDTKDELKELISQGAKVVTMNGTHRWALDNDITPGAYVMVDARKSIARFVDNPHKKCKYFIGSQCDPEVFDRLKDNEVHIFHLVNNQAERDILDKFYLKRYFYVIGGSTVMLRSIWLMTLLGFRKYHLFGFDSCYMDGKHHAYEQQENDGEEVITVDMQGRKFRASAWMVSQYQDFQKFVRNAGQNFKVQVYGDGLIVHMMNEIVKEQEALDAKVEERDSA